MKGTILTFLMFILLTFVLFSCSEKNEDELVIEDDYSATLLKERTKKDFELKNNPHSPFKRDPNAKYDKLKYFDPDTNYIFKSKLYRYGKQDTIIIMGTKGEERKAIKEGYVVLNFESKEYKLNVYKSFNQQSQPYFSIWFTDLTTGNETYKIGRYLDFEFLPNEDFVYTIDFNKAFNPYCDYSELFTCPIPTEEDHLNFEVKAGEKSFH